MINVDEICFKIYGEINTILSKNKLDTDAAQAFAKREIESYFTSLYRNKKIILIPEVRFVPMNSGLTLHLYSGKMRLESIEQLVSLSGHGKDV